MYPTPCTPYAWAGAVRGRTRWFAQQYAPEDEKHCESAFSRVHVCARQYAFITKRQRIRNGHGKTYDYTEYLYARITTDRAENNAAGDACSACKKVTRGGGVVTKNVILSKPKRNDRGERDYALRNLRKLVYYSRARTLGNRGGPNTVFPFVLEFFRSNSLETMRSNATRSSDVTVIERLRPTCDANKKCTIVQRGLLLLFFLIV